jgi:signal recognition particle receptor subunit beta
MPYVLPKSQTLCFKVVYYGPGRSGKTTNMERLHAETPEEARGKLLTLDTDEERTLFFDHFPALVGKLGGYRVKLHLYSVPGQSFYNNTRKALLQNVDGIVFVADSDPGREEANLTALQNLFENLRRLGHDPETLPIVFQWNKRDLPNATPIKTLEAMLNPDRRPSIATAAHLSKGVMETRNLLLRGMLKQVREHQEAAPLAKMA